MAHEKILEERIRGIEDREAIKELSAWYFWHAVRGETQHMAQLFTTDGIFDARPAGGPFRPQGREELARYFDLVLNPFPKAIPMSHNHIIKIDGDKATGTCVFETRIGGRLGGGFVGYYKDTYRRENGEWLFVERLFDNYAEFPPIEGVVVKPVKHDQ